MIHSTDKAICVEAVIARSGRSGGSSLSVFSVSQNELLSIIL